MNLVNDNYDLLPRPGYAIVAVANRSLVSQWRGSMHLTNCMLDTDSLCIQGSNEHDDNAEKVYVQKWRWLEPE